jgi:hypothetical protein
MLKWWLSQKKTISKDVIQSVESTFGSYGFGASIRAATEYDYFHYNFNDDENNNGGISASVIVLAITGVVTIGKFIFTQLGDGKEREGFLKAIQKIREVESSLGIKSREEIHQLLAAEEDLAEFDKKLALTEEQSALLRQENPPAYLMVATEAPSQRDLFLVEELLLELEGDYVSRGIVVGKKPWW